MANFGILNTGTDKKDVLEMVDILRKNIVNAKSIPVCQIESFSDLNNPFELNVIIKMKLNLVMENKHG